MKSLFSPVVLRNFGALLTLQAGTYLIPLLLVPYLIRTLGLALFGTWMFAFAFVVFARICVSYGFDLTATRQVAGGARESPEQLSEILVDVTAARLIIWVLSFVALIGASFVVPELAGVRLLMAIAFFILLGEALFPVWLYQGMETMGAITQLRLGSKLVNVLLVLALVKGPEDLLLVPLLEAVTSLAAGLIALVLAWRRFRLHLVRPRLNRIVKQLRDGGHLFVSILAVQFYTTINVIVLGFVVGPVAVGAYSLADKIYSALRGILGPFVQAVFPAMARLHGAARADFTRSYRSVLIYLLPLLSLIGAALFLTAGLLVSLASGSRDEAAVMTLQVFALSFPFAVGSFLSPMLVVRGRSATLMLITMFGGVIGLILALPLARMFGAPGAAAAFLAVQIYNSVALIIANRMDDRRQVVVPEGQQP